MKEIIASVEAFLAEPASRGLVFHNEAEMQHELGYWLRTNLGVGWKIYFERPAYSFRPAARGLAKKEIDLIVTDSAGEHCIAIELKCPRNGRVPETVYDVCKDLQLLEQVVDGGFAGALFLIHVTDPSFYRTGMQRGIYAHFRAGVPLTGIVPKPTGAKDTVVSLKGTYQVAWRPHGELGRYWLYAISKEGSAVGMVGPSPNK